MTAARGICIHTTHVCVHIFPVIVNLPRWRGPNGNGGGLGVLAGVNEGKGAGGGKGGVFSFIREADFLQIIWGHIFLFLGVGWGWGHTTKKSGMPKGRHLWGRHWGTDPLPPTEYVCFFSIVFTRFQNNHGEDPTEMPCSKSPSAI